MRFTSNQRTIQRLWGTNGQLAVDLSDLIPEIPALLEEQEEILAGLTTVACLGHI